MSEPVHLLSMTGVVTLCGLAASPAVTVAMRAANATCATCLAEHREQVGSLVGLLKGWGGFGDVVRKLEAEDLAPQSVTINRQPTEAECRAQLVAAVKAYAVATATLRDVLHLELGRLHELLEAIERHGFSSPEYARAYWQWSEFSDAHARSTDATAATVEQMINAVEVALLLARLKTPMGQA